MSEKEEKILYTASYAGEEPEKASSPFVMAIAAAEAVTTRTALRAYKNIDIIYIGFFIFLPFISIHLFSNVLFSTVQVIGKILSLPCLIANHMPKIATINKTYYINYLN